jgi:hypothetical protein
MKEYRVANEVVKKAYDEQAECERKEETMTGGQRKWRHNHACVFGIEAPACWGELLCFSQEIEITKKPALNEKGGMEAQLRKVISWMMGESLKELVVKLLGDVHALKKARSLIST